MRISATVNAVFDVSFNCNVGSLSIILTGVAAATIVRGDKQIFLSVAFKTRQQNTRSVSHQKLCAPVITVGISPI
jgi:hypothetical protein